MVVLDRVERQERRPCRPPGGDSVALALAGDAEQRIALLQIGVDLPGIALDRPIGGSDRLGIVTGIVFRLGQRGEHRRILGILRRHRPGIGQNRGRGILVDPHP